MHPGFRVNTNRRHDVRTDEEGDYLVLLSFVWKVRDGNSCYCGY